MYPVATPNSPPPSLSSSSASIEKFRVTDGLSRLMGQLSRAVLRGGGHGEVVSQILFSDKRSISFAFR